MFTSRNYKTDNGDTWVIGGKLKVEAGATVEGLVDAEVQAQADWNETDSTEVSFIKNKPEIPEIPVADNVAECEAEDVAGCVTSINAILTALKDAGLMEADAE